MTATTSWGARRLAGAGDGIAHAGVILARLSRRICLGLAISMLTVWLLAACDSGSSVSAGGPAVVANAMWVITLEDDQLVVRNGGERHPVRGAVNPDGPETSVWTALNAVRDSAAIDNDHVAVIAWSRLWLIAADGTAQSTPCLGCHSVAAGDGEIVVARPSSIEGRNVDITWFSTDLTTRLSRTIKTAQEKSSQSDIIQTMNNDIAVLVANRGHVWLAFQDREGGYRGGSYVIARYGRDGNQAGHLRMGLRLHDALPSPDGRYIALRTTGSGGACATTTPVEIARLTDMVTLDSSPEVPLAALGAQRGTGGHGISFLADRLRWRGSTLDVLGTTRYISGASACDEHPRVWLRSYDTRMEAFTDTELDALYSLDVNSLPYHVGPDCVDIGWRDGDSFTATINGVTESWGQVGIVYAPTTPESCDIV